MSSDDSEYGPVVRLFRTAVPASPSDVRADLWSAAVTPQSYVGEGEKYQAAVLEQYKLCVEMADRVSARRAAANAFFLTLNSAAFTAIGYFWQNKPNLHPAYLVAPLLLLLALCLSWFWIVRSYRQLNSGKYAVIGALEERLPASPYWKAEWTALGQGRDSAKYWPITHLEQWIPGAFGLIYVGGFVAALFLSR